ncbi:ABC-type glycerol-3-phosphate transport system substrate-binding protein [Microbacterium resistens]|uniref:ABC-type glycerol-3-phosphate transport system substrate-binding protein n=1 Tax=Microbacterium resistens TaxID=156977 RepID=A0ABU1SCZ8_9MICO|nr:extracellular solute-binding protein [Microbacterium resistens]MDR6867454.1 ABC-type glycerol-3-phosphate transport system substrate-binding protein [Microbacterium resistens]
MKKPHAVRTAIGTVVSSALVITALAACAPQGSGDAPSDGPVEILIGNRPAATEQARRDYFDQEVKAFTAEHPDITVTVTEDGWDPQTFSARLAAGDLPTVVGVPFTEIRGLIARGQVAEVGDAAKQAGLTDLLNPQLASMVTGPDDKLYGVPTSAYAMGLVYNRALFTAAGLDPAQPPTTWDEVRTASATIAKTTGRYGFAQVTKDNQGGWVLGAQIASRGGSLVDDDGKKATFDSPAGADALTLLKDMRWTDESLSPNGLMGAQDLAQAFGAGQVGMFVLQSDAYQPLTELLGFPPADFGFAAMPTVKAGEAPVTLSGGNIDIVSPDATEPQKRAALEWIRFHHFGKFENEDTARAAAQVLADQGTAVAIPGLPVVTAEIYERYLGWISEINNVPVANFRPYLDRVAEQEVRSEPPTSGQDIYAVLDPVVQAVITDQNADIKALLADANARVQSVLGR